MREFFKNLYYNTDLGRILIDPFLRLRNTFVPQKILLRTRFKRMLGYALDLNNPKSLNEKFQWLKLNDRSELHELCADKYRVRGYIKKKIGEEYLIPLIMQTKNPEDLTPDKLPSYPFIIKTNHNSGGVQIVRDKNVEHWPKTRKKFKTQLNHTYDSGKGEWQYKNIEPRLVVEKLLMDDEGNIPPDFKLHCMNGKVKFIQVDLDRAVDHRRNLYDTNWNLLPCRWIYENGHDIGKPKAFDEMVSIAEELAKDFICVRVDLYNVNGKIYFGELTFHSESGFGEFYPQKWDFELGEKLALPIISK